MNSTSNARSLRRSHHIDNRLRNVVFNYNVQVKTMKPPTQQYLNSIMNLLDWSGHVELGDRDMLWLAGELAAKLAPGDMAVCEVCSLMKPIVISTPLGYICEDCIDNMSDEVEDVRESLSPDEEENNAPVSELQRRNPR